MLLMAGEGLSDGMNPGRGFLNALGLMTVNSIIDCNKFDGSLIVRT